MPARAAQRGAFHHDIGIGRDALAMEGRRRDAPLTHVECAFAGDKPFAEQDLHPALRALLDHLLRMMDEHLADELRVVDEDDVLPTQFVMRDAAVGGSQMLEEQDGVGGFEEAPAEIEEKIQ